MKFKLPKLKYIIIVLFLMFLCLASGYSIGSRGYAAKIEKGGNVTITRAVPIPNLDFSLFWKVWDNINTSYFDKTKLNDSKMVYGAIQGMVGSLGDPYTMFLPPSENKIINQDLDGNFDGVGIEIGFKGNQLAVIAPLSDSPAEKAGVKAGDFIIGIKDDLKKLDITTENLNLAQAVDNIRGPAGSKVTLTLVRNGEQKAIKVDLVRQQINVPSVSIDYQGTDGNVAHISISKFGGDTFSEWLKFVKQIDEKPNIKGIVLDLRNNPGGYLQDAVDIAGEFLPNNSVAVIQQGGNGAKNELRTNRTGSFIKSNVVVLVNGGSASASEILSGALRDDRKIQLIGEKTFGKGTIQEPQDLDGGAGIHITIAKWLTPSGTWVHGVGLTPDIEIKNDLTAKTDVQLEKAVQVVESM